jgi:hypothetical protein
MDEWLNRITAALNRRAFDSVVAGYDSGPSAVTDVPAPLEWHPAYRDKTWLLDWLNTQSTDVIQLPTATSPWYSPAGDEMIAPTVTNVITLTKHRCWGRAPYVGDPFVYVWTVGVDSAGRTIASDSVRQPVPHG